MTDDFQLFQDAAGDDAIDADIVLITAYLARELSPVQVVAVEDRLAKDAAFLAKVRPVLDAWTLPTPLMAAHAGPGPLSRDEVEAGWQRYVGEHAELDAHDGPRLTVESAQRKRRKISMTRIAAGIAAITLPVITLAQVAVYMSHHPDVPGHSVAKQVVAPFVAAEPAPAPPVTQKALPSPEDVRVGRPLEKATPVVQRVADARIPVAPPVQPTPLGPVWKANPDRARIGELVIKHMPAVTHGDTIVSYVVLVLDASDNYVWGTYGNGSLQIRIGGDKRSQDERAEFNKTNASEYTGMMPGLRGGGGGGAGGFAVAAPAMVGGGGGGMGASRARGGGGAIGDSMVRVGAALASPIPDSVARRLADSLRKTTATLSARSGTLGASVGGGRVGGFGFDAYGVADSTGAYQLGFRRIINGQIANLNEAAGLQDPNGDESGIQGLKSSSLTMGETYLFAPGQLANQPLRVVVVHLAPGTSWKGR